MYGATFVTMCHNFLEDKYVYGYAGHTVETDSCSEVFNYLVTHELTPKIRGCVDYGRLEYSAYYCGVARYCYTRKNGALMIVET